MKMFKTYVPCVSVGLEKNIVEDGHQSIDRDSRTDVLGTRYKDAIMGWMAIPHIPCFDHVT